jgi:phenylpropionate dioxygenase-like ring-hydroxylating dioxygenase large terminal subunit
VSSQINKTQDAAAPLLPLRADYIPKEDYTSPEILALEKSRLFPRVWQIACRLEEIPQTGDFVTYDIGDDSILILRDGPDSIKAHFNVCQHRGRQLKEGCGNTGRQIQCPFHGWRWNLDGSLKRVKARQNWDGCQDFDDASLALKSVQTDIWAGWVWINMDPDGEPLRDYLSPVPQFLDGFLLENLRFNWYRTIRLPCNWKTVLDAFNEGYHTEATHPQMAKYGLSDFPTRAFGNHGMFYATPEDMSDAPAAEDAPVGFDARKFYLDYVLELNDTLGAMFTENAVAAAQRMVEELPPDATPLDVGVSFLAKHREVTEEAGAVWPADLSPEKMIEAGLDWHIFPNTIVLPTIDGALWYRARPDGDNPNSCFYDVWSLGRYAPGKEPKVQREMFESPESFKGQCFFLEQDLTNLRLVQKGMRSRGFTASRTNPVQEVSISNFHRALRDYLNAG